MTYPLLEKAPKDQSSEEFLTFLRENNEVIEETSHWLIIANCKYDTHERRWYTAFAKGDLLYPRVDYLYPKWAEFEWRKHAPKDQSVPGRFHIHLIEKP